MATLSEYQSRLSHHFTELHAVRGDGRPIFALEHGLSANDREELSRRIREVIAAGRPVQGHLLPWIVFAAELGYRFSGDEYWQTFGKEAPGWTRHGDRERIRDFFERFHREYGGVRPSGAWAENFTIICWPIANAILPLDLQRHMARILYDLRGSFEPEMFESPSLLGKRIEELSWTASSRFQNLAQEHLLIGQIAAALLFQAEPSSESLILTSTLNRITADLERQREARHWLRGASETAQAVKARGIRTPSDRSAPATESAPQTLRELSLEPQLVLRPSGASTWDVILELPDLRPLLRFPGVRPILTGSRVTIPGSVAKTPRARGWLLYGPQTIRMTSWPDTGAPLLEFERSSKELEYLLATERLNFCSGARWLFRVQSDGLGHLVGSNVVRPGNRYILVNRGPTPITSNLAARLNLTCDGATAVELDIPDHIDPAWQQTLEELDLAQSKGIDVWPIGLPPARWDGEGQIEYLTGSTPRIAITTDHPIGTLRLSLDDADRECLVAPSVSSAPNVLELDDLQKGAHTLDIFRQSENRSGWELLGTLEISMRNASPTLFGSGKGSPLVVLTDPINPSLEEFWRGGFTLEAFGPVGREVSVNLGFVERVSDDPFAEHDLPPVLLPLRSDDWRKYVEANVRQAEAIWSEYDRAYAAILRLVGDELGSFTLVAEREYTSVRWIIEPAGDRYNLRLADDTDSSIRAETRLYDFRSPDVGQDLDPELAPEGFAVRDSGGLFVARTPDQERAVLIPPKATKLEDLRIRPQIGPRDRSVASVEDLVRLAELWHYARTPGNPFALTLQHRVLMALHHRLWATIAGENWGTLEREFVSQPSPHTQDRLLSAVAGSDLADFIKVLDEHWFDEFFHTPLRQRIVRLVIWAKNNLDVSNQMSVSAGTIIRDIWLAELALRLASAPHTVRSWAGDLLAPGLRWLLSEEVLSKVARFVVLAVHSCEGPIPLSEGRVYGDWDW